MPPPRWRAAPSRKEVGEVERTLGLRATAKIRVALPDADLDGLSYRTCRFALRLLARWALTVSWVSVTHVHMPLHRIDCGKEGSARQMTCRERWAFRKDPPEESQSYRPKDSKRLGEMNPLQPRETTMGSKTTRRA